MTLAVTTISPATGHTLGGYLVEIVGTGFELPPEPPASGVAPVPEPSVRVTFGGAVSGRVAVVSATRLLVVVPVRALPVHANGSTAASVVVDVVVENLDQDGGVTASATASDVFTYRRPDVSGQSMGPVALVSRELVVALRSRVVAEVVLHQSVAYDSDVSTVAVDPAKLPQLVLTGPTMTKNTFYTDGAPAVETIGDAVLTKWRPQFWDLQYDAVVITNSEAHLQNLMSLISVVLDRSSVLEVSHVGKERFNLEWLSGMQVIKQPGAMRSDVRLAKGTFAIIGVPVNAIPGTTSDGVVEIGHALDEDPELAVELKS